jgi:hypothetical protein
MPNSKRGKQHGDKSKLIEKPSGRQAANFPMATRNALTRYGNSNGSNDKKK